MGIRKILLLMPDINDSKFHEWGDQIEAKFLEKCRRFCVQISLDARKHPMRQFGFGYITPLTVFTKYPIFSSKFFDIILYFDCPAPLLFWVMQAFFVHVCA